MWKNFSQSDFDNCDPKCKAEDMDKGFMQKLQMARDYAGIPFVLTSAYRSKEHDLAKGRSGTGAHTSGHAVDIRYSSGREAFIIWNALSRAGFTRMGISKSGFIHVDNDPNQSPEVYWTY